MKRYVVLDLETTGLSRSRHNITEIAAVRVEEGVVVDKFHSLVNPCERIPRFITRLTGITDDMVRDCPTIDKILPDFLDFLGEDVIVAHNATFDYGFISHNVEKHVGIEFRNKRLCTRKLANRLLSDLPSKRLSYLCEHFEIVNTQAHRAMADTLVTADIFSRFLAMMYDNDVEDIFKFESSRIIR